MWQLPQQSLAWRQMVLVGYQFFKYSLRKMHVLFTLFLLWAAVPYVVMSATNTTTDDIFKAGWNIKIYGLLAIYLVVVFWLYGAYYHQLNLLMRNYVNSAGGSLWFAIKKLPVLIMAFILAFITNILGWMLFGIPGIYCLVVITLYYPLIMIDDLGPLTAFKRSFQLVKNNWWYSAFILLIPLIASALLTLIVAGIVFIIGSIIQPPAYIMTLIYIVMEIMLSALFLPMTAVVNSLQIHNLKIRNSTVSSESKDDNLYVING